ncbi:hypothetical protein DMENIID0001_124420 [Sergentomyia squamirostris]
MCRGDLERLYCASEKVEGIRIRNPSLAVIMDNCAMPTTYGDAYELLGLHVYGWKDMRIWRDGPIRGMNHEEIMEWLTAMEEQYKILKNMAKL